MMSENKECKHCAIETHDCEYCCDGSHVDLLEKQLKAKNAEVEALRFSEDELILLGCGLRRYKMTLKGQRNTEATEVKEELMEIRTLWQRLFELRKAAQPKPDAEQV